jgi:hypothetical protein
MIGSAAISDYRCLSEAMPRNGKGVSLFLDYIYLPSEVIATPPFCRRGCPSMDRKWGKAEWGTNRNTV